MGIEEIHTGPTEVMADDFDMSSLARAGRTDYASGGAVEAYDQSSRLGVVADRLGARDGASGASSVAAVGKVASHSTSAVASAVTAGVGVHNARRALRSNVSQASAPAAAASAVPSNADAAVAAAAFHPASGGRVEGMGPVKSFGYAVRGEEIPSTTPYRATFKEGFKAGMAGKDVRTKGVLRKHAPKPAPVLDDNLGTTIGSAAGAGIEKVRSSAPGAFADFQSLTDSDDFAEGMVSIPLNRVKRRVVSTASQAAASHFKWKAPVSPEQKAKGVAGALENGKAAPRTVERAQRAWRQTSRRAAAVRRSVSARVRRAFSPVVEAAGSKAVLAAAAAALAAAFLVVSLIAAAGGNNQASAGSLTGTERAVAEFFLGKGLDAEHTAAIMGNIGQECGFDLNLIENGPAGGYGLFQWPGDDGHTELAAMKSWCTEHGYAWDSLDGQLEYCWAQITGEADGGFTNWFNGAALKAKYGFRGDPSLEEWESVSDVADATEYFVWGFLRPTVAGAHLDNRIYGDGTASHKGSLYYYNMLTSSGSTSALVDIAMSKQGCLYSWNTDGPNTFDCSGLVSYCLREAGLAPEGYRKSAAGILADCSVISKSEACAGDLVCYLLGGHCYHVGIYLGDGTVISANGTSSDHGDNPNAYVMITAAEGFFNGDALYVRWQN